MEFCLPKHIAKDLRQAAIDGKINMQELYDMESSARRDFFAKYTNKTIATKINTEFEAAKASGQAKALTKWAEKKFGQSKTRKQYLPTTLSKIKALKETGALTADSLPFYEDLISDKLGVTLTQEEANTIGKLSTELDEAALKKDANLDLPSIDYWKKRKEIEDYILSLSPASNLRIATSTIGRGNMLLSIKSPIVNILGNTLQGVEQAFERRLVSKRFWGKVDKKVVKQYIKYVDQVFKQTGYDVTRMQEVSEGRRIRGEDITHSEGKGAVRKVGRIYEDTVFKYMMGYPDVKAAAWAFADSANLGATLLARQSGSKNVSEEATRIFKDAVSLTSTSSEGEWLRAQSIADAQFATFTNDSSYSAVALTLRKALNSASGDVRLGDLAMPFVKTPANVVGMTLDAAGLGLVRGASKIPAARRALIDGDPVPMRQAIREMARTGFGITVAVILASAFNPDDFIGAYPTSTKERELLKANNGLANSVKIGGKWISLDYFGFMAAPLIGIMYARKYGNDMAGSMFDYIRGGLISTTTSLPGLETIADLYSTLEQGESGQLKVTKSSVGVTAVDFIRPRVIPGITYDIAKAMDTVEREVPYNDPVARLKAYVPGMRQQLPEKKDVFGDVINQEPAWSTVLFGSRVKTERTSQLIEEMNRLEETDNLPSLTRPDRTSDRMKAFKEQVSEQKYQEALEYYFAKFKNESGRLIQKGSYQRMSDEEKAKELNRVKADALDAALKRFGYKKK